MQDKGSTSDQTATYVHGRVAGRWTKILIRHRCETPNPVAALRDYEPGSVWTCVECGREHTLCSDQRDGAYFAAQYSAPRGCR